MPKLPPQISRRKNKVEKRNTKIKLGLEEEEKKEYAKYMEGRSMEKEVGVMIWG